MKSQNRTKRLFSVIIPCILFFAVSCQLDVPVKEMVSARQSIDKAYTVRAGTYSPDKLKEAESLLLQSHEFMKKEDDGEAKNAALKSIKASTEAFNKSLPPYSAEILKKAEDKYISADKVYSEKFSPSEFTQAGDKLKQARDARENKEYLKSIEIAEESYTFASRAERQSLQNGSILETELQTLDKDISSLRNEKAAPASEKMLNSAEDDISAGKSSFASGDYRQAYVKIESAKKNIGDARISIKKNKITEDITSLRNRVKTAQKDSSASKIKDDLDKAILALNSAESSAEQNNFDDAEMSVDEARKLLEQSDARVRSNAILEKIAAAEKKIKAAVKEDKENKYENSITSSNKLLIESRELLNAGEYEKSSTGAKEADTIISAVLNSLDEDRKSVIVSNETKKDTGKTEEAEQKKTDDKTYTVKWRKKNTDCLWRIALKVYNDAKMWPAIYIANKDQIKDPDLIFPGQKFTIPPKPAKRPDYKKDVKNKAVREEMK